MFGLVLSWTCLSKEFYNEGSKMEDEVAEASWHPKLISYVHDELFVLQACRCDCGNQDVDGEPIGTGDVIMYGHGVDHGSPFRRPMQMSPGTTRLLRPHVCLA